MRAAAHRSADTGALRRRGLRACAESGLSRHRGQHLFHAAAGAAAEAGRGCRRAQRDQVSQRPRRRGRGLLGGAQGDHGPDPHGQTQGHYGRNARAAGGVFDPARSQDAQGTHGRRLRKHAESGGLPYRLQVCAESVLSQSGEPSRSRRGRPRNDAILRRCLVRDGQLRGSQEGAQPRASVRAGRQPWRLRDAHPASGFHDALHVHERRDRGRRLLGSPDPSGGRSGRHRYIIADLQQAFEAAQN